LLELAHVKNNNKKTLYVAGDLDVLMNMRYNFDKNNLTRNSGVTEFNQ